MSFSKLKTKFKPIQKIFHEKFKKVKSKLEEWSERPSFANYLKRYIIRVLGTFAIAFSFFNVINFGIFLLSWQFSLKFLLISIIMAGGIAVGMPLSEDLAHFTGRKIGNALDKLAKRRKRKKSPQTEINF